MEYNVVVTLLNFFICEIIWAALIRRPWIDSFSSDIDTDIVYELL